MELRMALEPMQGNWASSWIDLGYTDVFPIPAVTSGYFQNFESGLGDSMEFHQGNKGSLCV